jgi:hypothetical protein
LLLTDVLHAHKPNHKADWYEALTYYMGQRGRGMDEAKRIVEKLRRFDYNDWRWLYCSLLRAADDCHTREQYLGRVWVSVVPRWGTADEHALTTSGTSN